MGNANEFAFQQTLIQKGIEETQKTIARFEELLFKIMTSAITVWVAICGWSITIKSKELMLVGIPALICFWSIAVTFRAVQLRYVLRSKETSKLLADKPLMVRAFAEQQMPDELAFRMHGDETALQKLKLIAVALISPTVLVTYLVLLVINLILFCSIEFPAV